MYKYFLTKIELCCYVSLLAGTKEILLLCILRIHLKIILPPPP